MAGSVVLGCETMATGKHGSCDVSLHTGRQAVAAYEGNGWCQTQHIPSAYARPVVEEAPRIFTPSAVAWLLPSSVTLYIHTSDL